MQEIKTLKNKHNNSYKWFAIYTKSRCEKKLAEQLKAAGITVFSPLYTTVKQWSDRKKKVVEPLIRQIIFIQTEEEKLNEIYSFPHANGIVKEFGKPAVIKDHEIKTLEIIAREWSGETISTSSQATFEVGDNVSIERGPFTGLTGQLIEKNGKHRLVVKLQTLNVEFTINIAKSHTKKCKVAHENEAVIL